MSDQLTIAEVTQILGISPDSVMRKFAKVKGVVDIGSPETPKKRRYRVLRIPLSVVEKYLRDKGGPVSISPPERNKPVGPANSPTEDELCPFGEGA